MPTNLSPANGASNVLNTVDLTWSFGANTTEYQLLFGTIYPPTTAVVNWTSNLQTSYALSGLQSNTQYFWKLNVRNEHGVTSGEIWGFVTTLTVPDNLTVTLHDDAPETNTVSASLSWTASQRSHRGYNIYRNNEKLNTQPYTTTSFTDASLERNYSYTYHVTAVYDEGESIASNTVTVETKGVGTFEGYVFDAFTNQPIEGATLTFEGANNTATTQTNSEGYYLKKAYKDTYSICASKQGYTAQTLATTISLNHNVSVSHTIYLLEEPYPVSNVIAALLDDEQVQISWNEPDIPENQNRAFQRYDVWRERQNGTPILIGNTTDTTFIDADWETLDWGIYRWFVEVKYDLNQVSQPTYSNQLEKDMNTNLQIRVNLNSGESQYGIDVSLKNTSEPLLNMVFEGQIDSAGKIIIDPIRKGIYELKLSKPGFYPKNETIEVVEPTSLFYLMEEKIVAPSALFVSPTAKAVWIGEERVFDPHNQSFDQGIFSDGWKSVVGEDATVPITWKVLDTYFNGVTNEYYSLNGSPFAMIDSEVVGAEQTVEGYLMSPVIDASMVTSLFLDFDQYLSVRTATISRVEVYNGSEWITVLNQTTTIGSWNVPDHKSIDLSPYINTRLQFRFHYQGNYEYFWAIDNMSIYTTTSKKEEQERSLNYYKVFLDGIFVANTPDAYYNYNTNNLTEGRSYLTEVLSVFSTGVSEKSSYSWTYVPCENYAPPTSVTANQLYGTINIRVAWTNADLTHVSYMNIYRNGDQVARIPMEEAVTFWVDEYLAFGTYTYTLEYEYDDGGTNCANTASSNPVLLQSGGQIRGTITAILDDLPIAGATITASNSYMSFSTETDAEGFYSMEVIDGFYTLSAAAAGFDTLAIENVYVPYTATIEQDFQLYEYPYPPINVTASVLDAESVLVSWEQETVQNRAFVHYKIYRSHLLTSEVVLLDSLTATSFVDQEWGELSVGAYKWSVAACYELNESEQVFSEKLDKDMYAPVTLQVATNNDDTPDQTRVCFVNTKELEYAEIVLLLDETGSYMFEDFRKGIYDITLFKHNYTPIVLKDVSIMEATDLNYMLLEEILPVKDFYVGSTGYAKWKCPGYAPFSGFYEDFNFGISEAWTVISSGAASTWTLKESTQERFMMGSPYIVADSDALSGSAVMDEKICSPICNVSICHELYLSFYQYYRVASEDEFSQVEVFDGTEWICVLRQTETIGSWSEPALTQLDLTPYINENFQVRFHYYSPNWNWYWAIDNVMLTGSPLISTPVVAYKMWLDGELVSETTTHTHYKYENENFVEGETYLAEVQAIYLTGESEKRAFEWTYESCTHFLGAIDFDVDLISVNDVQLIWENPTFQQNQNRNQTVFNQADFITHQDVGANGADISALYGEALNFGKQANHDNEQKVADDFVLSENTFVEQIEFYAYQTNSSTASTITGVYVELFDANPAEGGQLVWGDPDANVMRSTVWTGVYRTSAEDFTNTDRPIMKVVATINTLLPAGNYWVVVSFTGTLTSGPLVIPRQILDEVNTGNALQYNGSTWTEWIDSGSLGQMGLPLIVRGIAEGTISDKPFIGANIYRNGTLIAELLQSVHYVDRNVPFDQHDYCITLVYEDYAMSCFDVNCIAIQLDFPCWKPYNLDAAYIYNETMGVQLTWQWQPDPRIFPLTSGYTLTAFNIYRKAGGEAFELFTQIPVTEQATNYEYIDYDLSPQTAFYYQVKAVYEYTGGSCESNAAPSLHNPDEDFVIVIVTGIDSQAESTIAVYPNPAKAQLYIVGEGIRYVRCFNMLGEHLFDMPTNGVYHNQFDVSSFEQGVYLLQIHTDKDVFIKRFVVSK
ncbi:MAG: carboxypeptidase regulatory-like domain-containing protein [Lentimicrobiaceae bacterium]|nr:carboxypeptidase regulatory-like domain-containing protein [Lentimicrobiaceae bacterium]